MRIGKVLAGFSAQKLRQSHVSLNVVSLPVLSLAGHVLFLHFVVHISYFLLIHFTHFLLICAHFLLFLF